MTICRRQPAGITLRLDDLTAYVIYLHHKLSTREYTMPMPLWWGHINKRVFNPREIRKGKRPTLTHIGRSSGKSYVTPLDAHPVDGGYMFILVYGSKSDWVQNIMKAGTATLQRDGAEIELASPTIVSKEVAEAALPDGTKIPSGLINVDEFLRMDIAV